MLWGYALPQILKAAYHWAVTLMVADIGSIALVAIIGAACVTVSTVCMAVSAAMAAVCVAAASSAAVSASRAPVHSAVSGVGAIHYKTVPVTIAVKAVVRAVVSAATCHAAAIHTAAGCSVGGGVAVTTGCKDHHEYR